MLNTIKMESFRNLFLTFGSVFNNTDFIFNFIKKEVFQYRLSVYSVCAQSRMSSVQLLHARRDYSFSYIFDFPLIRGSYRRGLQYALKKYC